MSHQLSIENLDGETFEQLLAADAGPEGSKRLVLHATPQRVGAECIYVVTALRNDEDESQELIHTADLAAAIDVYNKALLPDIEYLQEA